MMLSVSMRSHYLYLRRPLGELLYLESRIVVLPLSNLFVCLWPVAFLTHINTYVRMLVISYLFLLYIVVKKTHKTFSSSSPARCFLLLLLFFGGRWGLLFQHINYMVQMRILSISPWLIGSGVAADPEKPVKLLA